MRTTTVGAQGHGSLSASLKAADTLPSAVLTAANPTEVVLPATLALVVAERVAPEAAYGVGDVPSA
ncbi:hypothetical protein, partial [Escherichia coli]|uniref:hypothetical protein n=1 Tax=Escherichia coli TaxID=562 RepID=UPI0030796EA7